MPQQQPADRRPDTGGEGTLIEKGWTVYDAVEHPIGTVTDVDIARSVLTVDGRPAGLGTFEAPLDLVARFGGNEVHLTKVIEPSDLDADAPLRLVDPPPEVTPPSTARARGRARTGAASAADAGPLTGPTAARDVPPSPATPIRPAGTSVEPVTPIRPASTSVEPVTPIGRASAPPAPTPAGSFSQFSPPYARTGASETTTSYTTPDWGDSGGGWNAKKIGMAALAIGGLAAAGYVMRRRARRKTTYERIMDAASDYLGLASDYAGSASGYASGLMRDRNPAWVGALAAAAALPLAYYAWPSSQPTHQEQARAQAEQLSGAVGSYWQGLTGRMPAMADGARGPAEWMRRMRSTDDVGMSSGWARSRDWSMPGDWSMTPDVALPIGLVAISALALYLARRTMARPRPTSRIRDIMTRQPRVIQPDATVADAAAMMRRLDVGALPVCDGSRLIGMLTDRDITTRSTADGRDPHLTPVRDVMSPGVAWATEDDLVDEAVRIMREHQIRRLPIVDERHSLVGVVSLGDLATEIGDDEVSGDTLERISE
jgi:CBS domain-containing protein